jgi:hypothetical protein
MREIGRPERRQVQEEMPESALVVQMLSVKLVSRRWTRVGFYIDIEVGERLPRLKIEDYGDGFTVSGPGLELEAIHNRRLFTVR